MRYGDYVNENKAPQYNNSYSHTNQGRSDWNNYSNTNNYADANTQNAWSSGNGRGGESTWENNTANGWGGNYASENGNYSANNWSSNNARDQSTYGESHQGNWAGDRTSGYGANAYNGGGQYSQTQNSYTEAPTQKGYENYGGQSYKQVSLQNDEGYTRYGNIQANSTIPVQTALPGQLSNNTAYAGQNSYAGHGPNGSAYLRPIEKNENIIPVTSQQVGVNLSQGSYSQSSYDKTKYQYIGGQTGNSQGNNGIAKTNAINGQYGPMMSNQHQVYANENPEIIRYSQLVQAPQQPARSGYPQLDDKTKVVNNTCDKASNGMGGGPPKLTDLTYASGNAKPQHANGLTAVYNQGFVDLDKE